MQGCLVGGSSADGATRVLARGSTVSRRGRPGRYDVRAWGGARLAQVAEDGVDEPHDRPPSVRDRVLYLRRPGIHHATFDQLLVREDAELQGEHPRGDSLELPTERLEPEGRNRVEFREDLGGPLSEDRARRVHRPREGRSQSIGETQRIRRWLSRWHGRGLGPAGVARHVGRPSARFRRPDRNSRGRSNGGGSAEVSRRTECSGWLALRGVHGPFRRVPGRRATASRRGSLSRRRGLVGTRVGRQSTTRARRRRALGQRLPTPTARSDVGDSVPRKAAEGAVPDPIPAARISLRCGPDLLRRGLGVRGGAGFGVPPPPRPEQLRAQPGTCRGTEVPPRR